MQWQSWRAQHITRILLAEWRFFWGPRFLSGILVSSKFDLIWFNACFSYLFVGSALNKLKRGAWQPWHGSDSLCRGLRGLCWRFSQFSCRQTAPLHWWPWPTHCLQSAYNLWNMVNMSFPFISIHFHSFPFISIHFHSFPFIWVLNS